MNAYNNEHKEEGKEEGERERERERVGNSKNATGWDLIYVCIEWKIRKSIWAYKLVCCCSHEKLKIDNVRETEH